MEFIAVAQSHREKGHTRATRFTEQRASAIARNRPANWLRLTSNTEGILHYTDSTQISNTIRSRLCPGCRQRSSNQEKCSLFCRDAFLKDSSQAAGGPPCLFDLISGSARANLALSIT